MLLYVFDITRYNTFEYIIKWIQDIFSNINPEETIIFIVGNKLDLIKENNIENEYINIINNLQENLINKYNLSSEYKIHYFEISAKTNKNVVNMFDCLVNELYKNKKNIINNDNKIQLSPPQESENINKKCCF